MIAVPTPALLSELAQLLRPLLQFTYPADTVVSQHFRANAELGRRDRAFLAESAYAILRHLRSLEAIVGGDTPPRPRPLIVVWLARYSGLNLRQCEPLLKPDEIAAFKAAKSVSGDTLPPALQLELPDWLYAALDAQYGAALPELMQAMNAPAPLDLRVNSLQMNRDKALAEMLASGFSASATPHSPLGIRLGNKPPLQQYPLFQAGTLEVQDEGSQLLTLLTGARRGEMVCDFCAGAGGKTLALGAQMHNSGRLYAFDVSEKRLAKMKPRLARSGLSNVQPQVLAHENDSKVKRLAGKFDRVLIDAPCSGLGTLRRNPDLKWRQTAASVAELQAKQASILASAARLAKPGGRVVYATCSLLGAENQAIVEAFLANHPEFTLKPAAEVCAALHLNLDLADPRYLTLNPVQHGTDGFFAAILERHKPE